MTVGVARPPAGRAQRLGAAPDEPFGGTDIEPAAHDFRGECGRVSRREQRPCVSGGKLPLIELAAHRRRQGQQPHRIRDMAAAFAHRIGKARLSAAELAHQPAIGLRLLQRRQILALEVFHQCDLERFRVGDPANDDRNLV